MAILVIEARRTLAYCYAIRFYLRGPNKQNFFDFLLKELEADLEKLTVYTEMDWTKYLDTDIKHNLLIGKRFIDHKMQMVTLRTVLEKHFNDSLLSIQSGLPEIHDDMTKAD
jgi:hypothetical protein